MLLRSVGKTQRQRDRYFPFEAIPFMPDAFHARCFSVRREARKLACRNNQGGTARHILVPE
jgi:hypothetical protein